VPGRLANFSQLNTDTVRVPFLVHAMNFFSSLFLRHQEIFKHCKTKSNLNYIYVFIPYRAVNILSVSYGNQSSSTI
jgi:hypothetical protein